MPLFPQRTRPHERSDSSTFFVAGLVAVLVLCLSAFSWVGPGAPDGQVVRSQTQVKSLIVQYVANFVPADRVPIPGSSKVTDGMRRTLRLGPALGNGMWRVDFVQPVTREVAQRVAAQLQRHRLILIAEIDEQVGLLSADSINR